MTEKAVREIKFEKGATFTTQFIIRFDREWGETVRRLKRSGRNLKIPIIKK